MFSCIITLLSDCRLIVGGSSKCYDTVYCSINSCPDTILLYEYVTTLAHARRPGIPSSSSNIGSKYKAIDFWGPAFSTGESMVQANARLFSYFCRFRVHPLSFRAFCVNFVSLWAIDRYSKELQFLVHNPRVVPESFLQLTNPNIGGKGGVGEFCGPVSRQLSCCNLGHAALIG